MLTQIHIDRTGLEGQGVGFDSDKNIYFVEGALPGDTVVVESESTKRYRDARLVQVVIPSPDRITPCCPHFQVCGGCDWLHWNYASQLKAKQESLNHILMRANVKPERCLAVLASPKQLEYRNRVQLRQEGHQIGFLKRGSHEIVDVSACRLAHPAINQRIAELREKGSTVRKKIEISLNESGQVEQFEDSPHGVGGFRQVNVEQNEVLKTLVHNFVKQIQSKIVLELYCGDGNLTSAYATTVSEVVGIDVSAAALERARTRNLIGTSFVRAEITGAALQKLPTGIRGRYDTLILDPPRAGVGAELLSFIHPQLKSIIYVSCSPLTFSQDVKALGDRGFVFRTVQPLDMFPNTRHIELVSLFSR